MKESLTKLNKNMFTDIIVFSLGEPGSMGPRNMRFYTKDGESFSLNYLSSETPYAEIRELFPTIKGCYWNGPMKHEMASSRTIVLGGSDQDKETKVADGWKHIYLDVGNHLMVKKEYYEEVKRIFAGKDNCDITFFWTDMLDEAKLSDRLSEIENAYFEQLAKDELLANTLTELKQNPEYIAKMKEASGDLEKMMQVLEEFSGIKMTWFELKQFGFRQAGLV